MDNANLQIRELSLQEVRTVIGWAANEGWNPGLSDAESFYKTDPEGFFGAFVDGQLSGAISAVRYENDFAFIGLFIVKPELRGGVLGPLLAKKALERLQGFNIGVDGVEKKIHNYEGYGFKMAHYNIRHQGLSHKNGGDALKTLQEIPFDKLLDYDAKHFPSRRSHFLKEWINAQGHYGLASVTKGDLEGYGVIRICVKGFKIGPLFAKDEEVASRILAGLLNHIPSASPFQLDIPATNAAALAMASKLGLEPVFKTARMYSLKRPEIAEGEIFGISSFELG